MSSNPIFRSYPAQITIADSGALRLTAQIDDYPREPAPSGSGWRTDPSIFPATVSVTDDGNGHLQAQVTYPNGAPHFINTKDADPVVPAEVRFQCLKAFIGGALTGGEFEFGLYDSAGNLVSTATNGEIVWWDFAVARFPPVFFDTPGTYDYTIRELTPSGGGIVTDPNVYQVQVAVTQQGQSLSAKVNYLNGVDVLPVGYAGRPELRDGPNGPRFINRRGDTPTGPTEPCPPCGDSVCVVAQKKTLGGKLTEGQFTFGLFDENCAEVARAKNNACGNIAFRLPLTREGRFCYTMRELTQCDCHWKGDKRCHQVCVDVKAVGKGRYEADVCYADGVPVFINCYTGCPARKKQTANCAPFGGLFGFGNGKAPQRELCARRECRCCETFADYWNQTSQESGATKCACAAEVVVTAQKKNEGAFLGEGQFTFALLTRECDEISRAVNDCNGTISFPALKFSAPGCYQFAIKELGLTEHARQCPGLAECETCGNHRMTTDNACFPVCVIVTQVNDAKSGNGGAEETGCHLEAKLSYPCGCPCFVSRCFVKCPHCQKR